MRDRLLLGAYLALVIAVTAIHSVPLLALTLAAAFMVAGRDTRRHARRALSALLIFNGTVSLAYAAAALWQGRYSGHYLLLLNLRVYLLTFLTFLMVQRVNLFRAVVGRDLAFLLVLAFSQSITLRRAFDDFRLALRSRTLTPLRRGDLYRHAGALGGFLLEKSRSHAGDVALAMKSRGFFQ